MARGFYPAFRVNERKVKRVSRLCGELFKIVKLNAAISFAEGMNIVHVPQYPGRFSRKRLVIEACEKSGGRQPAVNIGHSGFDILAELELLAAFVEFDGADFTGPIVDVLKQVAVNRFQMLKVESSRRDTFGGALRDKEALDMVEFGLAADSELVSEYRQPRVEIRVAGAHSAAKGLALARM